MKTSMAQSPIIMIIVIISILLSWFLSPLFFCRRCSPNSERVSSSCLDQTRHHTLLDKHLQVLLSLKFRDHHLIVTSSPSLSFFFFSFSIIIKLFFLKTFKSLQSWRGLEKDVRRGSRENYSWRARKQDEVNSSEHLLIIMSVAVNRIFLSTSTSLSLVRSIFWPSNSFTVCSHAI